MTPHLFTPRDAETGRRLKLQVSLEESRKIGRGRVWRALITDLSGRVWQTRGAACSAPHCICDAVASKVRP